MDNEDSPVRMEVHDVTMVGTLTFNPNNMLSRKERILPRNQKNWLVLGLNADG
jgi:hypothetical protein